MTTEPAILQTKAKIKSADIEGARMTVEVILPYNNAWSQYSKSMSCLQGKVDKAAWVRLSALVDIDPETVVTLLYTEKPSDKGKGMYRDLVDVQVPGMAAPKDPNADAPLFPEEEPRKPAPRMSDQAFAAQAQKSYSPPLDRDASIQRQVALKEAWNAALKLREIGGEEVPILSAVREYYWFNVNLLLERDDAPDAATLGR